MTWLALLAAANTIALPPLSSDEVARADALYKYVFSTEGAKGVDHRRIDALTEQEREFLISFFHALLDDSRKRHESEGFLLKSPTARNLARLGDQWGLEAVAQHYRGDPRGEWRSTFKFVRNAKLIAMIGDLLFKDEEYEMRSDLGYLPTQETAAEGIIQTLKYAPQFQPDIPQWAQELEDAWSKPGGNVINILREWYRENEGKLRAGEFFDVRPGQSPRPTVAAVNDSLPSNAQVTSQAPPDVKRVAATTAPQQEPKSYVLEIVAVAALAAAALAGLLVFGKRRT